MKIIKNTLCHSFLFIVIPSIKIVIPSVLLSFLPNYCHSFRIIVILSELLSFFPNYCHFKYVSSWIALVPSHTRMVRKLAGRATHICEFLLRSYKKQEKILVKRQFFFKPLLNPMCVPCIFSYWNSNANANFYTEDMQAIIVHLKNLLLQALNM